MSVGVTNQLVLALSVAMSVGVRTQLVLTLSVTMSVGVKNQFVLALVVPVAKTYFMACWAASIAAPIPKISKIVSAIHNKA